MSIYTKITAATTTATDLPLPLPPVAQLLSDGIVRERVQQLDVPLPSGQQPLPLVVRDERREQGLQSVVGPLFVPFVCSVCSV